MKHLKSFLRSWIIGASFLVTHAAYAHPGHGEVIDTDHVLAHYVTSPIHLISIIFIVILAALAISVSVKKVREYVKKN